VDARSLAQNPGRTNGRTNGPANPAGEAVCPAEAGHLLILSAKQSDTRFSGHIKIIAPEHGHRQARRQNRKVTLPMQSNAGKSNRTIDQVPNEWWKRAEFKTYGFWSALPKQAAGRPAMVAGLLFASRFRYLN